MDGILNVLKPPGMTSHDVVGFLRRLLKVKKAGHTGTLDPDVAGVLPVCLGQATKIVQYITDHDKEYRGEITFGITTDTQDSSGEVLRETSAHDLTEAQVAGLFSQFTGELAQVPPMVSAVKVKGKRLYQYAREGLEVRREPRRIVISELRIIKCDGFGSPHPRVLFHVKCSRGTYIRTLCADIGEKSGYGAHMSYLLRTASGPFAIERALTLEEISAYNEAGKLGNYLISISDALVHMPEVKVHRELTEKIRRGNRIFAPGTVNVPSNLKEGDRVCLKDPEGHCLAIASVVADNNNGARLHFQPIRVF